ncbi:multidrug efflux SMR transporter [Kroppenstedtia pulmonis]|uniref:Multidrug efflux SMR transporter n=1 Tax=Kroppenstedtia pulmonis TaxID=1380685 RepID=A0A7D4BIN3_9BACL|nr:multidrug efflux SMR transporter [Kroppenstedtia pulmonis]QKG83750.1 multidrug efflux SMR transporter [Kroppenstedtia pulmonis]
MKAYVFLAIAIVSEVFGTSMLKAADGFSRLFPSIGVVLGFGSAFYFLSLSLQALPLNVTYAIWSGLGTALTALIGVFLWKETISVQGIIGLCMIIGGVAFLNLGK